jgi:hypothetical protein
VSDPAPTGEEKRVGSRLRRRAEIAVKRRRVFSYLVGVIVTASILSGLIAHLIDRKDFPTLGVGLWWAIVTLGTVGYGDVVPTPVGAAPSGASSSSSGSPSSLF